MSAIFNLYTALHNRNYSKSTSVIKVALTMKNTHTHRKPSCGTTKLTLFTVSRDERNTKEDTGKSMKNVLRYAKRYHSE